MQPLFPRALLAACALLLSTSAMALTLRATATYTGDDLVQHPLAGAQAFLVDADGGHIVCSATFDAKGAIDASHCVDGSGTYLMKIVLETAGLKVSNMLGVTWSGITEARSPVSGVVDFGNRFFTGELAMPATLYGIGSGLARTYRANFGDLPGEKVATIMFPAFNAGVPWTSNDTIHWPLPKQPVAPGQLTDIRAGDADPTALYHEFGHRLRHGLDSPTFGDFWDDVTFCNYAQNHRADLKTNVCFAFNEGWAEYHAAILDKQQAFIVGEWFLPPDPNDQANGIAGVDVNGRPFRVTHFGPAGAPGGFETEGNVAATLFILHNSCGGFANLWRSLQQAKVELPRHKPNQPVHSMFDYLNAFGRMFPACMNAPSGAQFRSAALAPQRPGAARKAPPHALHVTHLPPRKPRPAHHGKLAVHAPAASAPSKAHSQDAAKRLKQHAQAALASLKKRRAVQHSRDMQLSDAFTRVVDFAAAKELAWTTAATQVYAADLDSLVAQAGSRVEELAEASKRARFRVDILRPHLDAVADVLRFATAQRAGAAPAPRGHIDQLISRYQKTQRELNGALANRLSGRFQWPAEALPVTFAFEVDRSPGNPPPPTHQPPPVAVRQVSASCNKNTDTGTTHFWSFNPNKDAGTYRLTCDNGFSDTMTVQPGEFAPGDDPQPGHYRNDGWYYHGYSSSSQAQSAGSCRTVFTGLGVRGQSADVPCVEGTTEAPRH